MQDRELTMLTLARGETRRLLMEAGTTVLVFSGSLVLRGPLEWLAETILAPEQRIYEEQELELATGGWVDLLTRDGAQVVLLPRTPHHRWRQVVSYLERTLGKGTETTACSSDPSPESDQ
jgi:hypothetical protein